MNRRFDPAFRQGITYARKRNFQQHLAKK